MPRFPNVCRLLLAVAAFPAAAASAQVPAPRLEPTASFALLTDALTIRQPAIPDHPFTVTGASGAILGMQNGVVEMWQLPVKFFSGLHLTADVQGYPVPIDLNSLAAQIEVSPDHTTITYSHAAITVHQIMFVPAGKGNAGLGGMILFEIEAIRPATLTISLTPAMVREWPAPQFGQPSWDWRPMGPGGAYLVSTDNPELFGMIGMPNAAAGVVSPYQERPQRLPLQFKLHFDPQSDAGHLFPLLCETARAGEKNSDASVAEMEARMVTTAEQLPEIFARTYAFYAHFFDDRLVVHTPDAELDRALAWAELSIEQSKVTTLTGETGLVAGWYPSFDSARPGFGWFFGRDTLWSMYAIDSYGDASLAREAMDFLVKRQRADGKMMHEYSQTAGTLTGEMAWSKFPYEYAAADSTPLYLLAMQDYVRATGDLAFLRSHWQSLQLAYHFESTHDSDGDGVYDNSQGTGWVEGWPPKLPHQEMYLAALDRDATAAMAQLAEWMGDAPLAKRAQERATKVAASVRGYLLPNRTYAFSKNADGSYDPTLTIYPAVALWGSAAGMPDAGTMLTDWAAHHFATDWGTRAIADTDPLYDPISYHQGTVWPLFTGWTAMAEYRGGRPLEGFAALQRNVALAWAQDPGAVTEVLSGRFYQPLGRSSTHQLWSSAMTLAPAVRELFGLEPDAPDHTLLVHPHLPASWNEITLEHVHVGDAMFTVKMERVDDRLRVAISSAQPTVLCLLAESSLARSIQPCRETAARDHEMELPLPSVELELPPEPLPAPGAGTRQPRIIDETYAAHRASVTVEAVGGSSVDLLLRRESAGVQVQAQGAAVKGDHLRVSMPQGAGFVTQQVTVTW